MGEDPLELEPTDPQVVRAPTRRELPRVEAAPGSQSEPDEVATPPAAQDVEIDPDAGNPLVRTRQAPSAQAMLIAGAVLLVLAMLVAGYRVMAGWLIEMLATGYAVLLHTGLAFAALFIHARLQQRPLGNWKRAVGGLAVAMGAFAFVSRIGYVPPYPIASAFIGYVLGAVVFVSLLMVLFRWPAKEALFVGAIQVLIVIALTLHSALRMMIPTPPPTP